MKAKLFAALTMVTTTKHLWSASRSLYLGLKIMKNTASILTIALTSSHTFFLFWGNAPRMKSYAYSFERPALSHHN